MAQTDLTKIFHFIDVVLDYDKGFAKDGWITRLNENFSILEQLIFGGSATGISISATGFSLNNLLAVIASDTGTTPHATITVKEGLVVTLKDEDFNLFQFLCTTEDLVADLGDPAGSNVGPGGVDNSIFGTDPLETDVWVYYYIIAGATDSTGPALVISLDPEKPILGTGFEDFIFFRRLGAARWDAQNKTLIPAFNKNGLTIYRDNQLITDEIPGEFFIAEDVSSRVPPTSFRGYFSSKAKAKPLQIRIVTEVVFEFKVRPWRPNTAYVTGDFVRATSDQGIDPNDIDPTITREFFFEAQNDGTSGVTEPEWGAKTFPLDFDSIVEDDNDIDWKANNLHEQIVNIPKDDIVDGIIFVTAIGSGGGGGGGDPVGGGSFGQGGGGGGGASIVEYPIDVVEHGIVKAVVGIRGGGIAGVPGSVDGGDGDETEVRFLDASTSEDIVLIVEPGDSVQARGLGGKGNGEEGEDVPPLGKGGNGGLILPDLFANGTVDIRDNHLRPPLAALRGGDGRDFDDPDLLRQRKGGSSLLPGGESSPSVGGKAGIDGSGGGGGNRLPPFEGLGGIGGAGYARIRWFIKVPDDIPDSSQIDVSVFVGHPDLKDRDDSGQEIMSTPGISHWFLDADEDLGTNPSITSIVLRSPESTSLQEFKLNVRGFVETL